MILSYLLLYCYYQWSTIFIVQNVSQIESRLTKKFLFIIFKNGSFSFIFVRRFKLTLLIILSISDNVNYYFYLDEDSY